MPRFYERFARQYRLEPPPEFPVASPYPGIDHHLSGLITSAKTRVSPAADVVSSAHDFSSHTNITLLYSQTLLTPRSVFQDGSFLPATSSLASSMTMPAESNTRQLGFHDCDFRSFETSIGALFNFPSRYLSSIDLLLISRFWWRLPPLTFHSQETLLLLVRRAS